MSRAVESLSYKTKEKLLLFLSEAGSLENAAVAPTLAWIARSVGCLFDNYYSSYHSGIHYGGGDGYSEGDLSGGTVSGGRHFEQFYLLLQSFDVAAVSLGISIFHNAVKNLSVSQIAHTDNLIDLYRKIFSYFHLKFPTEAVMIGRMNNNLKGIESYFYPEIYYRSALGLTDGLDEKGLLEILPAGSHILTVFVEEQRISDLKSSGYYVTELETVNPNDDYFSVTSRLARRWAAEARGWILGDPLLVSHWLPKACEEGLIPIYSIPQSRVLNELHTLVSSKGSTVFGRQFDDSDFFTLSRLNKAFQVIDPCRPPFQSIRHIDYSWENEGEGFQQGEPTDTELKEYAAEGRVLISLFFWSGMIRELENLYNITELIALTKMKCGLVLTSQSFEYMMSHPMEALVTPLDAGGIFPLAEPVLGSCGIGVGIESNHQASFLREKLSEAMESIRERLKNAAYMPTGWWVTLDTDLKQRSWWQSPKRLRWKSYPPYIQFRHHKGASQNTGNGIDRTGAASSSARDKIKKFLGSRGLDKYLLTFRPYEFYGPNGFKEEMAATAQGAGLQYMFSKSGFGEKPMVHYMDHDFIALNHTAGQWDGWTPFVTVNHVHDLKEKERQMLRHKRPGWIVSTIDSCLWTFSGSIWERGAQLNEIATFCSRGGDSGRLVNVHPHTVARYARILANKDLI
jgi:hypothetical protein